MVLFSLNNPFLAIVSGVNACCYNHVPYGIIRTLFGVIRPLLAGNAERFAEPLNDIVFIDTFALTACFAFGFYTPVFRPDVLWYGDVRPGLRPGLRPSVDSPSVRSPSAHFPHFSPTCFDILSSNFAHDFVFTVLQIKFECRHFASIFEGVMPLCELRIKGNVQFSTLFSYMLWHIELKFCKWLCFTVLQIKFECRQFALMFVGVMPLLELRILKIHSFPHFSLSCFDILSSNFAYDFVLPYYRSSSSVVNLALMFVGVMPLLELRIMKIHSFPHFSLSCFDILSSNFAYDFVFTVLQIKFECRHFASIFEGVMPLCELRIKVMCSFPHFSPTCFDILSSNFANDFVSPYYRSSSSAVNLR